MGANQFVERFCLLDRVQKLFEEGARVVVFIGTGGLPSNRTGADAVLQLINLSSGKDPIVALILQNKSRRKLNLLAWCNFLGDGQPKVRMQRLKTGTRLNISESRNCLHACIDEARGSVRICFDDV